LGVGFAAPHLPPFHPLNAYRLINLCICEITAIVLCHVSSKEIMSHGPSFSIGEW
jgi:hypothetical protein